MYMILYMQLKCRFSSKKYSAKANLLFYKTISIIIFFNILFYELLRQPNTQPKHGIQLKT